MLKLDPGAIAKERAIAISEFQLHRDDFIVSYLALTGIAKNELKAEWDLVPEAIKKAIAGKEMRKGFGLSGGFGTGKTLAVVAALRRHAEKMVDQRMAAMVERESSYALNHATDYRDLGGGPWPLWCNWPGESAANRAKLFQNQNGDVEGWVLRLQDPGRLLIIDDLGAEKATAQDWAGEVLGRVIDERLRHQGPTIWTSNLDLQGLMERYGPRTFSRLQAIAPIIRLPKLPDLRLSGHR